MLRISLRRTKFGRLLSSWRNTSPLYQQQQQQEDAFEWDRDGTISKKTIPFAEPNLSKGITNKDMAYVARGRPLDEILPMTLNLIELGKLELAEALIARFKRIHEIDWDRHCDPSLSNAFLSEYIKQGDLKGYQRWKELLFTRKNVIPDSISYSIIFKQCLAEDNQEECKRIASQLSLDNLSLMDVFSLNFLTKEEKQKLGSILSIVVNESNNDGMISLESIMNDLMIDDDNDVKKQMIDPSDFPNVNSVKSKSDGISFLKDAIKILYDDPKADLYVVQEKLERDCYLATTQRLRRELDDYVMATKATMYSKDMKKLIGQWQITFASFIQQSLLNSANLHETCVKTIRLGTGVLYSTILSSLEPEKISLICILELTKPSAYDLSIGGVSLLKASVAIGQALEREVFANLISKKTFLQHANLNARTLERAFRNRGLFESTMRKQYAALERNVDAIQEGWIPKWSAKLRAELGVYIVSLALECLKFTPSNKVDMVKAFNHKIVNYGGQSFGIIEAHHEIFQSLSKENATPFVEPWSLPMLVPPKPWITYNSGGYLTLKSPCVRFKEDPLHLALIHKSDKDGKLEKILLGLDVLGRTSWKINKEILKVALELWNSGINVATLEKPENCNALEFKSKDCFESHEEYVKYVRAAVERKEIISKAHSTMCDTNYKLEIARQFSGFTFYLPHSVDFRGRAYPIPPHLSHVGSDLSRGLLIFANGKPLGSRGLRWLKIQLANMAGYDKASLDEREAFANEHLDEIYDSADNPINGRQWWKQADEPWQCLATCMELTAALRSSNPMEYISHIPCQQDGSCNGLQHYAALGGDIDGAKQVNLSPSDRPQDVYSAVAQLVASQIETDAKNDPEHVAVKLIGKINRKIVKQTVMTNVYGVTMYGARQQIQDRLKEFNVVSPEDYKEARMYLAKAVFKSLGTLFDKAQRIQQWLTETAQEISRAVPPEVARKFGIAIGEEMKKRGPKWMDEEDPADRYPQTSVFWTTPLGFQVLQPYNKHRTVVLKTVVQNMNLRLSSKFDPVDINKQSSAFPPNFVHSLDATHMFMTALASHEAKITFASVHDCFWTHAATVDQMSTLLREQFVALHSQPILESLREEFVNRYRDFLVPEGLEKHGPTGDIRHIQVLKWRPIRIPEVPPRGNFDIKTVLDSEYFFS